jgi:hypothetical protein
LATVAPLGTIRVSVILNVVPVTCGTLTRVDRTASRRPVHALSASGPSCRTTRRGRRARRRLVAGAPSTRTGSQDSGAHDSCGSTHAGRES